MTIARRPTPLLAALAIAAALAGWAAFAADAPSPADPPAGQLLVASAAMQDPRFSHSVILLLRHDRKGAFGIVINRPVGERPLAALLADADKNAGKGGATAGDAGVTGTIRVFLGGPVQPQYGFLIHSADYRRPDTLAVGDGLAMTRSTAVLRDIGHRRGPAKYLFALGYAGWAPGQLEAEVARRDWFTAPAALDLVFDADRATLWEKALALRTREL